MIKVITLSGSFTDTCKNRVTAVFKCNIVNKLHNDDGFTNTGTTEETYFTTFCIRCKQIDNFNTRFKNFRFCTLVFKSRRISVNRPVCFCIDISGFIDRITDNVEDSSQNFFTNRYFDRRTECFYLLPSYKTFTHVHCDSSDTIITDYGSNFENQFLLLSFNFIVDFDRFVDLRNISFEINIDNRSNYL